MHLQGFRGGQSALPELLYIHVCRQEDGHWLVTLPFIFLYLQKIKSDHKIDGVPFGITNTVKLSSVMASRQVSPP